MSMTNSCRGSAVSVLENEVLSMCSGSVVGASDVMLVDSSWMEDEDWRAA